MRIYVYANIEEEKKERRRERGVGRAGTPGKHWNRTFTTHFSSLNRCGSPAVAVRVLFMFAGNPFYFYSFL